MLQGTRYSFLQQRPVAHTLTHALTTEGGPDLEETLPETRVSALTLAVTVVETELLDPPGPASATVVVVGDPTALQETRHHLGSSRV